MASEIRRRKNRLAATKCRRKKKAEERRLEDRKHMLHVQRSILQETAQVLAQEVFVLKNEVLRHASCNFAPLDNYISHAAGRVDVVGTLGHTTRLMPVFDADGWAQTHSS